MIPSPTYPSAGIWVPIARSYLSSTNTDSMANMFTALVPLGASENIPTA